MNQPLITKYRPTAFEDILGHEEILEALLRNLLGPTRAHAFLFTGPSGIGKTTIARIVATEIEAEILEIDAASNNGVDATRALVELGQHMSMSGAGTRMMIIDECHALSKQAWQPLLKLLEEPPDHLYISLCTTELEKVPETIRLRCFHVVLKPLHQNDIADLVELVAGLEGWAVLPDVQAAIVQAATGQPRKALAMLDVCHDATSKEEVFRIIQLQDASQPLLELCQFIMQGGKDWKRIASTLSDITDDEFESALSAMARYMISVMLRSEVAAAQKAWSLLDALMFPANSFDKKAVFYAAVGRMLWSQ